jgi:fatty-acyl-CoA synthase
LLHLGSCPADRIGIWAPNRYEWVVTQFASAKAGLILVTINPAYRNFRARVRAQQSRLQGARARAELQDQRLRRDARQIRSKVPLLRARS